MDIFLGKGFQVWQLIRDKKIFHTITNCLDFFFTTTLNRTAEVRENISLYNIHYPLSYSILLGRGSIVMLIGSVRKNA